MPLPALKPWYPPPVARMRHVIVIKSGRVKCCLYQKCRKMPTISGSFHGDGNGNFDSKFKTENELEKYFNGRFTSSIPAFHVASAHLDYNKPSEISGEYNLMEGSVVGPSKLHLLLNDPARKITLTMTGTLDEPIQKAYSALGSGEWHSSIKQAWSNLGQLLQLEADPDVEAFVVSQIAIQHARKQTNRQFLSTYRDSTRL
ncbi:hypothetical protein F5B22DRAFT_646724 [Xylaria bambusicola]|uniref:uncharacterized protein n=1 Tax=Xylaria bambusicola TaxID=326684 RepID=UPI002008DBD9|nr:uncharacterized protein F5B22DRAFT_646724 [Xylaria bambusicola]KAI0515450.1 hypothetical protein F5B22DRAFT_646724 [Xylaria bambusicola]